MRAIAWTAFLALLGTLVPAAAPAAAPPLPAPPGPATSRLLGLSAPERMSVNGKLTVAVRDGASWRTAGELPCDRFPRELALDLDATAGTGGEVVVRIAREGGGAAHLDLAALDGAAPVRVTVAGAPADATLLARWDADLLDVSAGDVELSFARPAGGRLALVARIEAEAIGTEPFRFPPENTFHGLGPDASFYRYRLGSTPAPTGPAGAAPGLQSGAPLFREWSSPGSGHPPGPTIAWVGDDGTALRAVLEFTSDNTRDGEKDYASVHVRTGDQVREFRVTEGDGRWGRSRFDRTGTAAYRHKTYEFAVPLTELGGEQPAPGAEIELAFSAYGTSTPVGRHYPVAAYDKRNNTYLVVYSVYDGTETNLYARRLAPDGAAIGDEIPVCRAPGNQEGHRVAYAPELGRFLVVWSDRRDAATGPSDVYGQFIGGRGARIGGNFSISHARGSEGPLDLAYDPVHRVFLVVWTDDRNAATTDADLFGRIVKGDGSLGAAFPIADGAGVEQWPKVAADTKRGRFLVVWENIESPPVRIDIRGRFVSAAGKALLAPFAVTEEAFDERYPALAFDPLSGRFLVVWEDYRYGISDIDLYGRMLGGDGSAVTAAFAIATPVYNQVGPAVALGEFGEIAVYFRVLWEDERTAANGRDVYEQLVSSDGQTFGSATNVNVPVATQAGNQTEPSPAYNANCQSWLVAYDTEETVPTDIGIVANVGVCPDTVRLTRPDGGEVLAAGRKYPIQWVAPPAAARFRLRVSPDGGTVWRTIADGVTGRDFLWKAPRIRGNRDNYLMRVEGFRKDGRRVGKDVSSGPFSIEVLRLDAPQDGAVLLAGIPTPVVWTTNRTARPVVATRLLYSLDYGASWLLIADLPGNPGWTNWWPPPVPFEVNGALVRVELWDAAGRRLAVDESDLPFTILP